ncbi:unnamed protein product [Caenorhabditis angaria]|uniref:Uncharacterized protein n=1 Tax=Caenorhabditis angaria TaxID=860376 RepID=A0A9P1IMP2_9PELO|nr:unnamed protein product [Caenorhabditis angaria]
MILGSPWMNRKFLDHWGHQIQEFSRFGGLASLNLGIGTSSQRTKAKIFGKSEINDLETGSQTSISKKQLKMEDIVVLWITKTKTTFFGY